MIKGKKIISALLIGTLCLGMSTQVRATEIDDTKQKAEELQKQKEAAESEQKSLETVPSVTFYTRRKSHERPVLRRIASCRQPLRKPY